MFREIEGGRRLEPSKNWPKLRGGTIFRVGAKCPP